MGSTRWSLRNGKAPEGQLDRAKEFLAVSAAINDAGPDRLAACSVRIPIAMDTKNAILAAVDLASVNTRSFEMWWDAATKKVRFVLVADRSDLDLYREAFLNMYPNAEFGKMKAVTPGWFDPRQPDWRVFDVGTYHGHYAAVFDKAKAHSLMTRVARLIQMSQNAWIQIVFRRHRFGILLEDHIRRLDTKYNAIKKGNYLSASEQWLSSGKKPHDHPERGHQFDNNYRGLVEHATRKMQSANVMMSIRGITKGDREISLGFEGIESMPVENIFSGHEYLTNFWYKYQNFYNVKKPKKVRVKIKNGGKARFARIEIFGRRLLPYPDKLLHSALDKYHNKNWLGRYRNRDPLPYLILTLQEIPLFVHLADPVNTPNIETTRGVMIPSNVSQKVGAPLGLFDIAPNGFAYDNMWGAMKSSKDADAAVLAPADLATHIYAVGASGSGKTSLIRVLAKHLEMWNRNSTMRNAFIYVDPKGDDAHKFVRQCDSTSLSNTHFLDPQKTKFSINPLELPAFAPWEREEVVSRYVGYFMKTIEEWYQQSASYVQMERIFRALLFYIYRKYDAPTFLDIHHIILKLQANGQKAIPEIIQTYGTPEPEMKQALESIATLKSDAFMPLLNRMEQFATDPVLRRMFSVRKGTVDFAELIRPGHQSIVRISPLNIPHHVQPLAMQAFILKLWFTIQERANQTPDESERTQVVLALDEFQIVKDLQVLQLMLEQARSLGLGLILSHQTTEQISDKQFAIITGNTGTQLAGKVNGKDAARIAQVWDPQFQKELQQQLSSQEYFHWTIREKATPGQEQPPPFQFWLARPPALSVNDDKYEKYIEAQLAKYGAGIIGPNAMAQAAREKSKWLENITVDLPSKTAWGVMCHLYKNGDMQQIQLAQDLQVQNREEVAVALRDMENKGLVERTGTVRTSPYRLAKKAIQTYFEFNHAEVGTAADVPEVAKKAAAAYIKNGLFVTVASQRIKKGVDRTDLVAYDYAKEIPISVEIESVSEVNSHPEHVLYNMTKWAEIGFAECHVWSKSPKIKGIREQLDKEQQDRVFAIVISS